MYYRTRGLGELSISFDIVSRVKTVQKSYREIPCLLIDVMFTGLRSSCHEGE